MRAPLDPGRPYVFMPNHASMVDIWAVFVAIPASFRFIAKKQLARIPLFGWAMAAGRFIFIDRQNAAVGAPDDGRGGAPDPVGPVGRDLSGGDAHARRAAGRRSRRAAFTWRSIRARTSFRSPSSGSREVMPRGAALIRAGTVTAGGRRADPDRRPQAPADREALIAEGRRPRARCWARCWRRARQAAAAPRRAAATAQ